MLAGKRGFTLLELTVTLAISVLVLGALLYILLSVFRLTGQTSSLTQAQITANTALSSISSVVRNANSLNISAAAPSAAENKRYIYASGNTIYNRIGTAAPVGLFTDATLLPSSVRFEKAGEKMLRVEISVYQNGVPVYTLRSELLPTNLGAASITGDTTGSCLTYTALDHPFVKVTSITVSSPSSTISTAGGTMNFSAQVQPQNASTTSVAWSVSDTQLARITQTGELTALRNGVVTVYATALDGTAVTGSKQIIISSQPVVVDSLSLYTGTGYYTVNKGASITILTNILPAEATNKTLAWSVSDTSIGTISSTGVFTAKNKGNKTVLITAKTTDGSNLTATITITVIN